MNASVKEVMQTVGKAFNDTFRVSVASLAQPTSAPCGPGVAMITLPTDTVHTDAGSLFDYVQTQEDLTKGQRIANYSVEFQRTGSTDWEVLVPPVIKKKALGDRPDGHDPRDQYVGHKRIDLPIVNGTKTQGIAKVRFNCIRSIADPVYIRSFSLHKKTVPWEQ